MDVAHINGVELEYEVVGSGEPVLLISPMLADGFAPLVTEPELANGHQLIRYHKRGWVGSTHTAGPVTIEEHAADAAALLDHLGVGQAHVAGHSSGAAVAAQLTLDDPERVHTLVLLELTLFSVPSGPAFLAQAGPVIDVYEAGDPEAALAAFLSAVSGMTWAACGALLDERVPGQVAQTVKDADTFFTAELPGVVGWGLSAETASAIHRPVLSVVGTGTAQLWIEVADFLREALPDVEEARIDGVGHLLHLERPAPVAHAIASFLGRHAMT
jgi:pimeloyl-ACP methyl ester carboxylesterase